MPQIPIIMPQLGESIAEATIVSFLVKPGDMVEADQDIIEVETNKATMNVPSPCPGKIENFVAKLRRKLSRRRGARLSRSQRGGAARLGLDAPIARQQWQGNSESNVSSGTSATATASAKEFSPRFADCPCRQTRGRELHVAADESAHGGTGVARRGPRGHRRQRRRRSRDHPGF